MRGLRDKVAIVCRRGAGEYRRCHGHSSGAGRDEGESRQESQHGGAQAWWMRSNPRVDLPSPGIRYHRRIGFQGPHRIHRQGIGGLDALFNVAAALSSRTIGKYARMCSRCPSMCAAHDRRQLTGYMYGSTCPAPLIARRGGSIVNTMSSEVWMGEAAWRCAGSSPKRPLSPLIRHALPLTHPHLARHRVDDRAARSRNQEGQGMSDPLL